MSTTTLQGEQKINKESHVTKMAAEVTDLVLDVASGEGMWCEKP